MCAESVRVRIYTHHIYVFTYGVPIYNVAMHAHIRIKMYTHVYMHGVRFIGVDLHYIQGIISQSTYWRLRESGIVDPSNHPYICHYNCSYIRSPLPSSTSKSMHGMTSYFWAIVRYCSCRCCSLWCSVPFRSCLKTLNSRILNAKWLVSYGLLYLPLKTTIVFRNILAKMRREEEDDDSSSCYCCGWHC